MGMDVIDDNVLIPEFLLICSTFFPSYEVSKKNGFSIKFG
jgi:hypothetical protein